MVTPARRQYLELKEQHPDALLLVQMGDFYEAFDDDARTLARDAQVHLTSKEFGRAGRVPLAGVPVRALDAYLRRLLAKGHRVAVCDQISEAGHGLVERAVTRVVTPGTLAEPQLLHARENTYLAAVALGQAPSGPAAALAYVDVSTGEFAVTPFAGPEAGPALAAELGRLAPAEVLAARGSRDEVPPAGAAHVTERDRGEFDQEGGGDALRAHFGVASLKGYGCHDLPLALGAAGAILGYLRENNPRLLAGLRGIRTYATGDFMTLDAQTRRNLELVRSGSRGAGEGGRGGGGRGLLGVLDRSCTAPGGRLLRRWLGQPLLNLAALGERHDAVAEFVAVAEAREGLRAALERVGDLERLTGRIVAGTSEPRELHALRATLDLLPRVLEALAPLVAARIVALRGGLDPCADLAETIERAVAGTHEGRRIRAGYDAELDALVDGIRDARLWVAELQRRERERTGIKSLKVGYNKVFGYYLEVTRPNLAQVPPDYLRKQTLANGERFITPELKEYEARIADAEGRIAAHEAGVYAALLATLATHAPRLLAVGAALAEIDTLAAFAEVAARRGYVRPALDEGTALRIRAGRHPTVEAALDEHAFIPNDIDLSGGAGDEDDEGGGECAGGRVLLLTGPNMAGKSTYLRQVALIALLAQIGSFVPAAEAHLGLVDRIFTRVGAQDDLAAGQSTFMIEMLETAAILHGATARSLIVLDEVGRGTGTLDGLAIARAVVEDIHDRIGARCLFATHYHELLALLESLPRLRACNVAVREEEDGIVFLHRIAPGGAGRSYGIHVARLAGLPRSVTERAGTLLRDLEAERATGGALPATSPHRGVAEANGHYDLDGHGGEHAPSVAGRLSADDIAGVLDEIATLDLVNTTPLAALNRLFAIQGRLRDLDALPVRLARVRGRGNR